MRAKGIEVGYGLGDEQSVRASSSGYGLLTLRYGLIVFLG